MRKLGTFSKDKAGKFSLFIIFIFFFISCAVCLGLAGSHWHEIVSESAYSPASSVHWFGTNFNGQDIFERCIYSTKTAFEVGILVAFFSILMGVCLGSLSGFYQGKWIDYVITWLFGCFDAIPFYLLAASIAFTFKSSFYGMHLAMIASLWTSPCKLIRAEFIKLRNREFIEAAYSLGLSDFRIVFRHILPNTLHIILVEFTLCFVLAIKLEAALSFIGLGVKDGVSWGLMIAEASSEILAGEFNNFFAASIFMSVLVVCANQLSDSLHEAL